MKPEIQKILEMNKAGTLTDEQAAALLEELSQGTRKSAEDTRDFGNPFSTLIKSALGTHWGGHAGASDIDGNRVQMSKLEPPFGRDFVFRDNTITLSSASRIELESAEMSKVSVNASKLDRVRVLKGKLSDCRFNGSSMDRFEIADSTVEGLGVNGSKFSRFTVTAQSRVRDLRVDACSFKNGGVSADSEWSDSSIATSSVSDVELKQSSILKSRFDASKISGLSLEGAKLEKVWIQAMKMEQISFAGSELKNITFSAGDSWRWQGVLKTRFENCQLENGYFSECRLRNTVIRNVTLKNFELRGVDLNGMTIDGNEAFLAAGAKPLGVDRAAGV